jgi:transglutaminase superfamily protein
MRELAQLIRCPLAEIEEYDIGALNMRCAQGLPGAEDLDESKLLDWLDRAARTVHLETCRHWYRFNANPAIYNNSAAYFCCYFLLQTLQEELGARYNPDRIRDPDFRDSRDLFIHGMIGGPGGTCASMPILYIAVGRRLGYPLKLVQTRAHFFVRWEDPEGKCFGFPERFNIEGSGEGIASYSDDYYRTWPEQWTEAEETEGLYLRSMSPREELAAFLVNRGHCLSDNGRLVEAVEAYSWASAAAPHIVRYKLLLAATHAKYMSQHESEMAVLMDLNRRNRQQQQRMLSGPTAHLPIELGVQSPMGVGHQPKVSNFHEAMTRYNRELMDWNRANQVGRAKGAPPMPPRAGVDY